MFFPHMTLNGEDVNNIVADCTIQHLNINANLNTSRLKADMMARIKKLNEQICFKVSRNFTSVNKAFLTLDQDHDGFIEPKDIVASYGAHITIEYADLVKVMEQSNSRKDGTGRLSYADFSRWMGNEIHNLASFIFRHDSKKNPVQDQYMKKQELAKGRDKKIAAQSIIKDEDVLDKLINKIRQQWNTVRKAFSDFNTDNDPYIDRDELIFFLEHWGFPLSDTQANIVFKFFDRDGDGQISYQDFVQSIGFEIHPGESFYFRQDMPNQLANKVATCDQEECWAPTSGTALFCLSHLKQNQAKVLKLYRNIYSKIRRKDPAAWNNFIGQLKRNANREDRSLIQIQEFLRVLAKFRLKLSDK